ncbi:MAG: putative tributyrin esterase [Pyrinomonadaceae bacterium]|nr:putative tributyrin esterase [Pyrinomonadaceae bacterium]
MEIVRVTNNLGSTRRSFHAARMRHCKTRQGFDATGQRSCDASHLYRDASHLYRNASQERCDTSQRSCDASQQRCEATQERCSASQASCDASHERRDASRERFRLTRARFVSLCCALLLALVSCQAQATQRQTAARVESVKFESKLVGKPLPYHVVLPPLYDAPESRAVRYPVIYLLHGLGGGAGDWVSERAHLATHAAGYRFIIVTPEGRDGWYTDSATIATDKFETYILAELIPDVERRYRALPAREARAVAGLSMGGYGALKFGVKHPQTFALAASLSGAFGAASWDADNPNTLAFIKPSISRTYGAMNNSTRAANDLFKLFTDLPPERFPTLPFFYFDCGTEDFLINYNRALSELLLKRKIPHEYRQLPGTHSWPYWDAQVQEVLKLAARKLRAAQ